ncbi:MAG TPA: hypothetical protein PKE45_12330, partial [Caldilineaceae bacterium]|nr:hypothetical protein [Caldilineaceae bacterium]
MEAERGETLLLTAFVAGPENRPVSTVYVEVVKGGQTYSLLTAPVEDGVAHTSLEIDGQLLGTLELNALVVDANGVVSRDRRLVLVNPAPAEVAVVADSDEYRPGQTARLAITVSQQGKALPGVVGVSIVDESVFAIDGEDAGFARTYFLLQRELQEPRYAIRSFSKLEDDDPSPYDQT